MEEEKAQVLLVMGNINAKIGGKLQMKQMRPFWTRCRKREQLSAVSIVGKIMPKVMIIYKRKS